MAKQLTNPITTHQITWMDTQFGWITLLNGQKPAGFIYFIDDSKPLETPHLSFDATYIVFSIHMSHLSVMLSILREEKPLQIRFFDPESTGTPASASIESAAAISEKVQP